jgi:metal-sulfur cluster biosynthetic enzyme
VREVVSRRSPVVGRGPTEDRPPYPIPAERQTGPLWDALREVMDPEIPISLVDLGLIYDVRLAGGVAEVDLTFTATACPCMAFIRLDIEERLLQEGDVDSVRIREVWNPPWTKARITPRGREQMKQLGVSM